MADTYRLVAGIVTFIVFISVGLTMASATFSDLSPAGTTPGIPVIPQPVLSTPSGTCDPGFLGTNLIGCTLANFFTPVINGLIQGVTVGGIIIGYFFGILTFSIPALQGNPLLQLLNFLIVVPILVVLGLFIFRLLKGLIPTVGGDAD